MAIDPNLVTTIRTGELPPVAFSLESKIPHEIGSDLSYDTIQGLVNFLQPYLSSFKYEVKVLHVNSAYILANFDETGLGKNICLGWAIMNGENGTDNVDGTFSMAYGAVNSTIGQTGGLKDVTLSINQIPNHTHENNGSASDNGDPGQFVITAPTNGGETVSVISSAKGGGQSHENRPPFRVELHIMKL